MVRQCDGKEKKRAYCVRIEPKIKEKLAEDFGSLPNAINFFINSYLKKVQSINGKKNA